MSRTLTAIAVAAACALATTGCDGGTGGPITYQPAAYGENGACYYVDDPAEAIALTAAGLCPSGWVPTLMPGYWHARYSGYYDSPAYYGTYVPVRTRTVYVTHVHVWESANQSTITAQSRQASWRGSNGSTTTGKVSAFSAGNARQQTSSQSGSQGGSRVSSQYPNTRTSGTSSRVSNSGTPRSFSSGSGRKR